MASDQPDQCFVVMPFGIKPLNDGSGRLYDFDKVYRVIIQRAIRQAGLEPVRADERKVSDIIHVDMFKQLRDRAVVLADLSLENPNVFYELGVRHVMSARGTVLMCRGDSELPFDVKLSRVIFYDYDGQHLDWEEVERIVGELQFALEEAKRGTPDSPVHALLEQVLPRDDRAGAAWASGGDAPSGTDESLIPYQRIVAEHWRREGASCADLLTECGSSSFGCRALAYACLTTDELPAGAVDVAHRLHDVMQYDLACALYERLNGAGALGIDELLSYGSAVSERSPTLAAADEGLVLHRRALDLLAPELEQEPLPPETLHLAFRCHHSVSGLYSWRWELSHALADLDASIALLEKAEGFGRQLPERRVPYEAGRLAHSYLKLLALRRLRDGDRERHDVEGCGKHILALAAADAVDAVEASYVRWYQAVALGDAGDAEGSNRMALLAFSEDAKVMDQPGCERVGRKQYVVLRRLLEHYSNVLRHPALVGHIPQVLQIGHRGQT
jgi:hypothetical protein